MIIIGNTLLSDEIYLEQFVCDLDVCKGGCCVEGDAGAPLTEEETLVLQEIYATVKPYMIEKGIATVEQDGAWVKDIQGEMTTPLVEGGQCAYVFFDEKGIAKCAIEKAWEEGRVSFQKPVSCHLYPIRISEHEHYDALNYHRWPICNCARKKGRKLKVRVYRFVKDALVRKYGQDWFDELEAYISYAFEGDK
jgi:hypothetical protein